MTPESVGEERQCGGIRHQEILDRGRIRRTEGRPGPLSQRQLVVREFVLRADERGELVRTQLPEADEA